MRYQTTLHTTNPQRTNHTHHTTNSTYNTPQNFTHCAKESHLITTHHTTHIPHNTPQTTNACEPEITSKQHTLGIIHIKHHTLNTITLFSLHKPPPHHKHHTITNDKPHITQHHISHTYHHSPNQTI
ncbi:uncharacterized histidine-rich protein DDB_G0274557-like [Schistocerca gregaria]|uniref:uncharacterized histidine-rich protein DDB_G0274557-like n=1 Tax=Schistocerca gregaria TaxID=7010 RepID=UPI00211DC11A|nr:uncharacterized histidine-rich protein DDB_G0274557-like [Schistocerca gregaria]